MSYMTKFVGPPLVIGIFDNILAMVKAVASSPSCSILSKDPVEKKGNAKVNENKEPCKCKYNRELLKYDSRRAERRKKRNMLAYDILCIVNE
ncbi:hypothetical protein Hanom_Chr14g01327671 [Helianthus anomalus]